MDTGKSSKIKRRGCNRASPKSPVVGSSGSPTTSEKTRQRRRRVRARQRKASTLPSNLSTSAAPAAQRSPPSRSAKSPKPSSKPALDRLRRRRLRVSVSAGARELQDPQWASQSPNEEKIGVADDLSPAISPTVAPSSAPADRAARRTACQHNFRKKKKKHSSLTPAQRRVLKGHSSSGRLTRGPSSPHWSPQPHDSKKEVHLSSPSHAQLKRERRLRNKTSRGKVLAGDRRTSPKSRKVRGSGSSPKNLRSGRKSPKPSSRRTSACRARRKLVVHTSTDSGSSSSSSSSGGGGGGGSSSSGSGSDSPGSKVPAKRSPSALALLRRRHANRAVQRDDHSPPPPPPPPPLPAWSKDRFDLEYLDDDDDDDDTSSDSSISLPEVDVVGLELPQWDDDGRDDFLPAHAIEVHHIPFERSHSPQHADAGGGGDRSFSYVHRPMLSPSRIRSVQQLDDAFFPPSPPPPPPDDSPPHLPRASSILASPNHPSDALRRLEQRLVAVHSGGQPASSATPSTPPRRGPMDQRSMRELADEENLRQAEARQRRRALRKAMHHYAKMQREKLAREQLLVARQASLHNVQESHKEDEELSVSESSLLSVDGDNSNSGSDDDEHASTLVVDPRAALKLHIAVGQNVPDNKQAPGEYSPEDQDVALDPSVGVQTPPITPSAVQAVNYIPSSASLREHELPANAIAAGLAAAQRYAVVDVKDSGMDPPAASSGAASQDEKNQKKSILRRVRDRLSNLTKGHNKPYAVDDHDSSVSELDDEEDADQPGLVEPVTPPSYSGILLNPGLVVHEVHQFDIKGGRCSSPSLLEQQPYAVEPGNSPVDAAQARRAAILQEDSVKCVLQVLTGTPPQSPARSGQQQQRVPREQKMEHRDSLQLATDIILGTPTSSPVSAKKRPKKRSPQPHPQKRPLALDLLTSAAPHAGGQPPSPIRVLYRGSRARVVEDLPSPASNPASGVACLNLDALRASSPVTLSGSPSDDSKPSPHSARTPAALLDASSSPRSARNSPIQVEVAGPRLVGA